MAFPIRSSAIGLSYQSRTVLHPDCQKGNPGGATGREVKGFNTNITKTCDEENKPNLITDVEVEGAAFEH